MSSLINHFYRFGDFTLDTDQRVLLREGTPVALTPKVFDTLLILVENQGRIVEKDQLMKRLWPDTFVEEANIAINIQQLRKSLADNARDPRYIETVARRGYRFIAEVETVLSADGETAAPGSVRFGPSAEAGNGKNTAGPLVNTTKQQFSKSGQSILAARDRQSSITPGRALVGLAVIVALLAAAGFVLWKLSNGRWGARGFVEPASSSPLKIETLTVTGQSRQAAISPDGKYIAYTRTFEKKTGVWLRQLVTNTNVEIVPAAEFIYGLAFAHSGEYLYFVKGDQPRALYRISLLGGVPTRIAENMEGNISVSADDSQIAFIRQSINPNGQRDYSLIVAKSTVGEERTISTSTHPYRLDTPVWSADGSTITCAYGNSTGGTLHSSLIEFSVADGTKKELSSIRFFGIQKLALLPNGKGLIMAGRKNPEDANQLWRVTYPGMEVTQISEGTISYLDFSLNASADKAAASQMTLTSDVWIGPSGEPKNLKRVTQATGPFAWTADGQLVYSSTASGNRDLWITRQDGSDQRQLTVNPSLETGPTITADNRYIIFLTYRTGTFQVWRMNLNGGNEVQLTNGSGKHSPTTSPDSKWVFYSSTDDWNLWKVSIDGGEPVRVTDYPAVGPSISPDGRMIACAGRTEPKQALSILIIPVEGGPPLKRIEVAAGYTGSRIRWTPDSKAVMYVAEPTGRTSIFKQSLVGGPPEEIASIDQDEIYDFDYSRDGKFLAVIRGRWQHDIVMISNLNP